jgi:quinoprotein glucose dehydrogenase
MTAFPGREGYCGFALIDRAFRAFDIETGKEVWKTHLPTSGGAPMTYQIRKEGKPFLVIAADTAG